MSHPSCIIIIYMFKDVRINDPARFSINLFLDKEMFLHCFCRMKVHKKGIQPSRELPVQGFLDSLHDRPIHYITSVTFRPFRKL